MSKYLMTVQVEFESFDDVSARGKMSEIVALTKINEVGENSSNISDIKIKLQEIMPNSAPRKIQI